MGSCNSQVALVEKNPPANARDTRDTGSHHFMANRWGNNGNSKRLYFGGSKITADGDCSHEIKGACSLEEKL